MLFRTHTNIVYLMFSDSNSIPRVPIIAFCSSSSLSTDIISNSNSLPLNYLLSCFNLSVYSTAPSYTAPHRKHCISVPPVQTWKHSSNLQGYCVYFPPPTAQSLVSVFISVDYRDLFKPTPWFTRLLAVPFLFIGLATSTTYSILWKCGQSFSWWESELVPAAV